MLRIQNIQSIDALPKISFKKLSDFSIFYISYNFFSGRVLNTTRAQLTTAGIQILSYPKKTMHIAFIRLRKSVEKHPRCLHHPNSK